MLELIYPTRIATLLPGSDRTDAEEMLPIVDTLGSVIAQASRAYCHSGAKCLHPVVHLHILNRQGEIYLQQRGAHKSLLPLSWDTAVGGHVSYGEYITEALYREAAEELGFYDFNPVYITSYEYESGTEKELVNVFAAVGSFTLKPNPEELEGGRFFTPEELSSLMGSGTLTPNFELEYNRIKDAIQSLL